jgi:hypothetical protein
VVGERKYACPTKKERKKHDEEEIVVGKFAFRFRPGGSGSGQVPHCHLEWNNVDNLLEHE